MSIDPWKAGTIILAIISVGGAGLFIGKNIGNREERPIAREVAPPVLDQTNSVSSNPAAIVQPSVATSPIAGSKPVSTPTLVPEISYNSNRLSSVTEPNTPNFPKGNSLHGIYVSQKNPTYYMDLKSDGTFFSKEMITTHGKYEIEGNVITLKFELGLASRGRIEGNVLIDPDGDRWVKK